MTDLGNRSRYAVLLLVVGLTAFIVKPVWHVFVYFLAVVFVGEILWALIEQRRTVQVNGVLVNLLYCLIGAIGFGFMSNLRSTAEGTALIVVNIATTISMDTGAYIFGKKFGKTPFWSKVSPNKTMEGFVYGYVASVLIGVATLLLAFNAVDYSIGLPGLFLLVISTPLVATAGDLLESRAKRVIGIKDYSNSLGSHGGFPDRFDSHILVFGFIGAIQTLLIK